MSKFFASVAVVAGLIAATSSAHAGTYSWSDVYTSCMRYNGGDRVNAYERGGQAAYLVVRASHDAHCRRVASRNAGTSY